MAIPAGELAVAQAPVERGAAFRIAAVVRAAGPGEEAEAGDDPELPLIGVREALVEPADRSGAHPCEHHAPASHASRSSSGSPHSHQSPAGYLVLPPPT